MNKIQFTAGDSHNILSPHARAKAVYDNEPCARTFLQDLELHLTSGYVFSTPRIFLLGRPVPRSADPRDIVDPVVDFAAMGSKLDCWHVYLAAGDLLEFFRFEPFPLPYFSWERENVLRFYRRDHVIRLCQSLARPYS